MRKHDAMSGHFGRYSVWKISVNEPSYLPIAVRWRKPDPCKSINRTDTHTKSSKSRYVDQINSCVLSRVKDTTPILNSLPRAYMFVAFSDIAIFHFNIAIISDDFFLSDLELGGVRIKDFDSNSLYYLKKKIIERSKT